MAQVHRTLQHQDNRILAALDAGDFAYLEPHLGTLNLERGQVLYEPGETFRYTYFPHGAMVSLVTVMRDGKSAEMAVFGREGLFGLVSAFATRQAFGRYIVQLDGSASFIELDRMHEAMAARPPIQQMVLRYTEALMAHVLQSVACNAVHSVETRCCRWILTTHDRAGRDDLHLTHEFLAEMVGVQRSTISDVVRSFQERGFIHQGRGIITVTNRRGLEQATCECYGVIRRKYEQLLPHTYKRD